MGNCSPAWDSSCSLTPCTRLDRSHGRSISRAPHQHRPRSRLSSPGFQETARRCHHRCMSPHQCRHRWRYPRRLPHPQPPDPLHQHPPSRDGHHPRPNLAPDPALALRIVSSSTTRSFTVRLETLREYLQVHQAVQHIQALQLCGGPFLEYCHMTSCIGEDKHACVTLEYLVEQHAEQFQMTHPCLHKIVTWIPATHTIIPRYCLVSYSRNNRQLTFVPPHAALLQIFSHMGWRRNVRRKLTFFFLCLRILLSGWHCRLSVASWQSPSCTLLPHLQPLTAHPPANRLDPAERQALLSPRATCPECGTGSDSPVALSCSIKGCT